MIKLAAGRLTEYEGRAIDRLCRLGISKKALVQLALSQFMLAPRRPFRRRGLPPGGEPVFTRETPALANIAERYETTTDAVLESAMVDFLRDKQFVIRREDLYVPYRR